MYWRIAVDSESEVDFRKGSDNWLVLDAMAWSVGDQILKTSNTTSSNEVDCRKSTYEDMMARCTFLAAVHAELGSPSCREADGEMTSFPRCHQRGCNGGQQGGHERPLACLRVLAELQASFPFSGGVLLWKDC